MKTIGFIGLGTMGKPMALNLLKKGYQVNGYDLFPEKARDFSQAGGTLLNSAVEVARNSHFIFTSVPSFVNLQEIMFGKNGCIKDLIKGRIFVDLSTIAPAEARQMSEQLAKAGHSFLDAPVSGGQKGAAEGTLTIMVGGDEAAFASARPLLEAISSRLTYMGTSGTGQATKLANNLMLAINTAGVAEALMLGSREGVDLNKLLEAVMIGSGRSAQLESHGKNMSMDMFPGKFPVKLMQKDLRLVSQTMIDDNLSLPLSATVLQLYNAAAAAQPGAGHEGVIISLEQLNGYQVGKYQG